MVQYGIKLSTKHPSETKNNVVNSYLKSIIFSVKNRTFYNIPIRIDMFCNQNSIGLKYFADIWFGIFLVHIDKNRIFSEMKILQCIQSDVVVNFIDVIRTPH